MDNLALYLLDLVQNSIEAKAHHISLSIVENHCLSITIKDNGCGMDEQTLKKAASPFYTSRKTRHVGLGLSLIHMLTEQTEGTFQLESIPNQGTILKVTFDHHHIDMPPMGNFGDMVMMIAVDSRVHQFIFTYSKQQSTYTFDLAVIKDMFHETLNNHEVMQGLIQYINQEIDIVRGKL